MGQIFLKNKGLKRWYSVNILFFFFFLADTLLKIKPNKLNPFEVLHRYFPIGINFKVCQKSLYVSICHFSINVKILENLRQSLFDI